MTWLLMTDVRINLWALHRAVLSRNGYDSVRLVIPPLKCASDQHLCQVSAQDEWPAISVALGFPSVAGGGPRCGPVIAQRLQQLSNDVLRLH